MGLERPQSQPKTQPQAQLQLHFHQYSKIFIPQYLIFLFNSQYFLVEDRFQVNQLVGANCVTFEFISNPYFLLDNQEQC